MVRFYAYLTEQTDERMETRGYFNAVLHSMLWSAPALLKEQGLCYAEQQRARAGAELAQSLLLGLPLFLSGALIHLHLSGLVWWIWGACLIGVGVYAAWDAQTTWQDANSQILHGIVESAAPAHLPAEGWNVSKHVARSLPSAWWRAFVIDAPK